MSKALISKQANELQRVGPIAYTTCVKFTRIEDPCSPDSSGQGIFDRKEVCHFQIRSLTPQQAAGNALAFAVQRNEADVPEMLTEPREMA